MDDLDLEKLSSKYGEDDEEGEKREADGGWKDIEKFHSGLPMTVVDGGGMLRLFTFAQSEMDVVGLMKLEYERMSGNAGGGVGRCEQRFPLVLVISYGHVSQRDDVRRNVSDVDHRETYRWVKRWL